MAGLRATRRIAIAGSGAAALALLAGGGRAVAAAPATTMEAANLHVVKGFIDSWTAEHFDPDAAMPKFFAEDARIRVIDSAPVVIGPAAAAAAFKPYLAEGQRFSVQILETFVRGPLVMTSRIDTESRPGKPERQWPVVGVL